MLGRRLMWSAGVGCLVALIWLWVSATHGDDLGAPAGELTGFALMAVVGLALARRHDPQDPWIWSRGAKATEEFLAACPPCEVAGRVAAMAGRRRGWRLIADDLDPVRIRVAAGMTPITWEKRIEVVIRPSGDRCLVTVTSASPQLIDWGENKRVVTSMRREIQGVS